jgi:uncharacterized membrane protein
MIAQRADRRTGYAIAFACVVYAVVLTLLGWDRYATFHSGADLGEFVQTIATPFSGFGDTPEGGSHFLHHFSPVLYLVSPLLLAAHTPLVLIGLQAIAGALIAPPIYLIVRKRAGARLALVAAFVALLYPPLVGVTFTDFHENGFAPATIAWLAWAIDARRWRWGALLVALALAIKEDEAGMLVVLGGGLAIWAARRGDRALVQFALGAALAGALVLVAFFAIIQPRAGAEHGWFALNYLNATMPHDSGDGEVAARIGFLLEAFVPLCFVPLLSWRVLLVVPGLIEVLASRWSITYTMGQHYAGVWAGEMIVVEALTLAAIAASRDTTTAVRIGVASLALCIVNLTVASPTHWRHYLAPVNAHDGVLDRFVAAIPAGAAVGTYDEVYSHLGFDPAAQIGFRGYPKYLIVDQTYYRPDEWANRVAPEVAGLVRDHGYVLVRSEDGVRLYRRAPAGE